MSEGGSKKKGERENLSDMRIFFAFNSIKIFQKNLLYASLMQSYSTPPPKKVSVTPCRFIIDMFGQSQRIFFSFCLQDIESNILLQRKGGTENLTPPWRQLSSFWDEEGFFETTDACLTVKGSNLVLWIAYGYGPGGGGLFAKSMVFWSRTELTEKNKHDYLGDLIRNSECIMFFCYYRIPWRAVSKILIYKLSSLSMQQSRNVQNLNCLHYRFPGGFCMKKGSQISIYFINDSFSTDFWILKA